MNLGSLFLFVFSNKLKFKKIVISANWWQYKRNQDKPAKQGKQVQPEKPEINASTNFHLQRKYLNTWTHNNQQAKNKGMESLHYCTLKKMNQIDLVKATLPKHSYLQNYQAPKIHKINSTRDSIKFKRTVNLIFISKSLEAKFTTTNSLKSSQLKIRWDY